MALNDSVWVDSLERRITAQNVAVADVRFPNEIAKIKALGGHVIRVVRGPEPEWYETAYNENVAIGSAEKVALISKNALMKDRYPDIHYSEWAWIGTSFDYVLDNNGSMRDLEANLSYVLKIFTGPGRDVPHNVDFVKACQNANMMGPAPEGMVFALRLKYKPTEEKVAS